MFGYRQQHSRACVVVIVQLARIEHELAASREPSMGQHSGCHAAASTFVTVLTIDAVSQGLDRNP